MKTGLYVYDHSTRSFLGNVRALAGFGFTAVGDTGKDFARRSDDWRRELGEIVNELDLAFTIHDELPDETTPPEEVAAWEERLALFRKWHDLFGNLAVLSWHASPAEREAGAPHLRRSLEAFVGTDVRIACENWPMIPRDYERLAGMDGEFPALGILVDIGHLHFWTGKRLAAGTITDRRAELARIIAEVPIEIVEVHVHSNNGERDEHLEIRQGDFHLETAARALALRGFDGISTFEFGVGGPGPVPYEKGRACMAIWEGALRKARAEVGKRG